MVVIFVDHYTVLGLPSGEKGLDLSSKDIKKAYKLKALKLHPDKKPDNPNAVADFQKLQASFDILKDEYARKLFNNELMVRLRDQRREQFVEKMRAEKRKRDEFEEMQRKRAVEREQERMRSEYKKRYREEAPNCYYKQWEKKIKREQSIREIYAKRPADSLFYDILQLRRGAIYV